MTNYADSHNKGLFALASLGFGSLLKLSLSETKDTGVALEVALSWCQISANKRYNVEL